MRAVARATAVLCALPAALWGALSATPHSLSPSDADPSHHGLSDGRLSRLALTCSELLELEQVAQRVRQCIRTGQASPLVPTAAVLANSDEAARDPSKPWFLAPCDLQAVKAAGVTFVTDVDLGAFQKTTASVYKAFPKWTPGLHDVVLGELRK
mgnify:CR=1 FL=1